MASNNTTKKNPIIAKNPTVNHMTLHIGNRYFCAICQDKGEKKENWGTPLHICHHCGRAFCSNCAPTLGSIGHFFLQHQELKWMQARGQRILPAQRRLEPAHCDECVHYAPRIVPWSFLGASIFSFLFLLLYYITPWDGPQLGLFMALLWLLWIAWGITWHSIDSWLRQKLYFPVDGGMPLLLLQEFIEAEGVLDGEYKETFRLGTPYGSLVATVPLPISMIEELNRFADSHRLSEDQLADINAVAGSIVMEGVGGILNTDQVWSQKGCRRWELAARLPEWPLLWDMKEDQLEQKVGPFEYKIRWDIRTPFPVQVQAHFPLRSDRRTVELFFTLTGSAPKWNPMLLKLVIKSGEKLPPFKLLPVQGRTILHKETNEIEVNELQFENNTARLQLRFEEPPAEGDEPLWLTGTAKLLVPGKTMSGAKIEAYYNAFGNITDNPRTKIRSWINLNFKVNVAKVPYQRISEDLREFVLEHTSAERDDVIIKALGLETQLIQAHERVQLLTYGVNALPPTREIVGRWPVEQDDDMLPVVYQLYLMPKEQYTQVQIRVEAPVHNDTLYDTQAPKYGKRLEQMIIQADQEYWASSMMVEHDGLAGASILRPYAKQSADLLSKIRNQR